MDKKIDWMLGMSDNMINISDKNKDKPMMDEISSMAWGMKENLDKLKMQDIDDEVMSLMEQMMRNMEEIMMTMNMEDERQRMMIKYMMSYILIMQMSNLNC